MKLRQSQFLERHVTPHMLYRSASLYVVVRFLTAATLVAVPLQSPLLIVHNFRLGSFSPALLSSRYRLFIAPVRNLSRSLYNGARLRVMPTMWQLTCKFLRNSGTMFRPDVKDLPIGGGAHTIVVIAVA